jgi:hypothetical protein
MSKVARDVGLKNKVVPEAIMSPDKWDHRLHKREANDGYHSVYMQPTCMEIGIRHRYLTDTSAASTAKAHKFRHRGANMALFMPFLHWGSEHVLSWREDKIRLIEERRSMDPRGPLPELMQPDDSPTDRFHTMLMEEQLHSEKPLHLRRTLDQFFYTNIRDTSDRDHDQVLSKYGPEGDKVGFRPILMVDQLWLWVLGGETVVTCFDRRWENDQNFHANVLDRLLQWKLPNNATRIKTAYDLAHIIIDEASGFFFSSTSSLPRSLRFAEVFRGAIGSVNSEQTRLFSALETLTHKGPAFELTRREQNELLSMQAEFGLVREVRDLVDELTMIRHVYDAQQLLLDPLFDMQYSDALFRAGLTDLFGNLLRPSDGDGVESAVEIASPSASFGFGAEGTPENGGSDTSSRIKGKGERQREREEQRQAMAVPIRWDERGWFNRTAQYMRRHREMIQDMMDDTEKVYTAVCCLMEAINIEMARGANHVIASRDNRPEAEQRWPVRGALQPTRGRGRHGFHSGHQLHGKLPRCLFAPRSFMLTGWTRCKLPLSFFSSVFGMNVVELTGPNGTILTFGTAMAYMSKESTFPPWSHKRARH